MDGWLSAWHSSAVASVDLAEEGSAVRGPGAVNLTCVVRPCVWHWRLAIIWGIGGITEPANLSLSRGWLAGWRQLLGSHSVHTRSTLHGYTLARGGCLFVCLADRTRGYTIVLSFRVSVGEETTVLALYLDSLIATVCLCLPFFPSSEHCHTHNRQKLYTVSRLGSRCVHTLDRFFLYNSDPHKPRYVGGNLNTCG